MESLRVSVDEAKRRWETGEGLVFLDTRAPDAWNNSNVRVPGAIRVDPHDVEPYLASIPRGKPIVTYCT